MDWLGEWGCQVDKNWRVRVKAEDQYCHTLTVTIEMCCLPRYVYQERISGSDIASVRDMIKAGKTMQ